MDWNLSPPKSIDLSNAPFLLIGKFKFKNIKNLTQNVDYNILLTDLSMNNQLRNASQLCSDGHQIAMDTQDHPPIRAHLPIFQFTPDGDCSRIRKYRKNLALKMQALKL